jgi:hypothetical protein
VERQRDNQLDERRKRGVMRGDGMMRSREQRHRADGRQSCEERLYNNQPGD